MLKMSTLKQTIFFLILIRRPGKDGSTLSPGKMKMAEDLAESLATEFIKIKHMRSILRTLIDEIGGDTILEILEREESEAKQKTDSLGACNHA